MRNKKYSILIILSAILLSGGHSLRAQGSEGGRFAYSGFSGGMMLHTGYVGGGTSALISPDGNTVSSQAMSGMPTGIGGAIRFGFGKHLRLGSEGYVSTLRYGDYASYASIGWGGILADWIWPLRGRFSPFAGFTVGGGSVKNLTLASDTPLDFVVESNASFRKYGFACVVPFVGVEFAASSKIHIMLKADYMFNVSNGQPDFVKGPRIYIGFSFARPK